jgi:hypothetical protein
MRLAISLGGSSHRKLYFFDIVLIATSSSYNILLYLAEYSNISSIIFLLSCVLLFKVTWQTVLPIKCKRIRKFRGRIGIEDYPYPFYYPAKADRAAGRAVKIKFPALPNTRCRYFLFTDFAVHL